MYVVDAEHTHQTYGITHTHLHEHLNDVPCSAMRYHRHHKDVFATIDKIVIQPIHINDDTKRGIYHKYSIRRLKDRQRKHTNCRYFVLDPKHDAYALPAMIAYANACKDDYPALATELRDWIVNGITPSKLL